MGTTEIYQIQEYPKVPQKLIRYMSTLRYYRTDIEVYSDLYSYSLFRVLSYNSLSDYLDQS